MNKRIGSLLLALMMLLSLFPASALAEGETVMDAYTPEPEYVEGPPTEITEEPAVIEEPAEEPVGDDADPQGPQPDVPEVIEEPAVVEEPEPIEEPAVVEEPEAIEDSEPIEKPEEVLEEEAPDAKTESDEAALASSGSCGENVNWTLDGDTLTITGTGAIADFSESSNPGWYSSRMDVKYIVIGSGVTRIGAYAFYQMIAVRSVTIPSTVTAIGMDAFKECRFLRSLQLPSGLQSIGNECFLNCVGLSSLDIPAGVTVIGDLAFSGCSGLKTVCFLGSAPTLYSSVFSGVTATVYYPGSDASWSSVAGQNYGGTLTWKQGGQCGDSVYWELSGGVLTISGSGAMTNYGFGTSPYPPWFGLRQSISAVVVQNGVTCIGEAAFYNLEMTSVSLPASLESIGFSAFRNCSSLTSVTLPAGLKSIGVHAFTASGLTSLTLPDGLESIGSFAFNYCKLTSVTIPASVTSIGYAPFTRCSSLSATEVASGSSSYTAVNGVLFNQNKTTLIEYPAGKTGTSYTIPSGVQTVAYYAFGFCGNLTSVTIPASVTSIEDDTFDGSGLTEILFLGDTPSFGTRAFNNVTATVYYPPLESWGTPSEQYSGTLTWVCNNKCGDNVTWALSSDGVLTISGTGPMWDYMSGYPGWYPLRESIPSAVIGSGVTSIGKYAFDSCEALTSVTIQEGVKEIGYEAFGSCPSLTSVTIPESVTNIADYPFGNCGALTSITIPASVTSIGKWAFYNCTSLTTITFKGSAPTIGEKCFYGVTATAYYPGDDASWTDSVKQNYGGTITWVEMALTLEPSELALPVTGTAQLKASGSVPGLVWTSSSEKTAVVDQNGVVTAKKYGKATITATVPGTDLSASCEVQTLFWDVADPSQYYFKHVYWAAEAGITNGYDLEYFGPQEECTREQMMTFLWRMAGKPSPKSSKNPFPDVPSSAYYYKAVLWGVENGITNGFSSGEYAGKFGVGLPCTREQAMTFLWRMAGKPNPSSSQNPFADIKSSDYYYKAVLWASQNGIANGYSSGEYAGKYGVGLACLREHMVTFLSRYNSKFN